MRCTWYRISVFKKCHECTTLRDVNSSRRYRPPNKSATTFSRPESMSGGKNKSRRGFTRMLMWNTKPFHTIPKKKARVACGSSYHRFYLERGSTAKWLLWAPSTTGEHVLLCVSHVKQFIFSMFLAIPWFFHVYGTNCRLELELITRAYNVDTSSHPLFPMLRTAPKRNNTVDKYQLGIPPNRREMVFYIQQLTVHIYLVYRLPK